MSIAPGRRQQLSVRTIEVPHPGDLLARLPRPQACAWVRRGEGLIGWGEAARLPIGAGRDRFTRADDELRRLFASADVDDPVRTPGTGPVAFCSFTFDPDATGSVAVVPRAVLGVRDGRAWLTTIGEGDGLTRVRPVEEPVEVCWGDGSLAPPAWMRAVERAVASIRAGRVAKVVLSRDVYATTARAIDPRALLVRLADHFPDCYTFSCAGLVGATPELLVRRQGDQIASLVLAGSTARGIDRVEDEALGRALLASAKDVEEHEHAVSSVRTALEPLAAELDVDRSPSLLVLANVQHLATSVTGRLASPYSALEVAGALHPTAAVCGTPTDVAMEVIRTLERMDRGRYAGPVGWLDARGNGEFGIALRCAEVDGPRARLFAGNGIVAGSDPEAELAETQAKLGAMRYALEG
ncbi:MAG: isochorismate synthase [Streptosporangiaceae bacterium]